MLTPMARPIVFVSDFGLGNEWVGLCHAVMSGISPEPDHRSLASSARWRWRRARSCSPTRCRTSPRTAWSWPWSSRTRRQGPRVAIETCERTHARRPRQRAPVARLEGGRRRDHGRRDRPDDVIRPTHAESFRAPVRSAPRPHLAAGMPIERLGEVLGRGRAHRRDPRRAGGRAGQDLLRVIDFNRFGNVQLNVRPADLAAAGLDARGRCASRPCPARSMRSAAARTQTSRRANTACSSIRVAG